jgi:subtilisin family serine protease
MRYVKRFWRPVAFTVLAVALLAAVFASVGLFSRATANTSTVKRHIVVFSATRTLDGAYQLGGNYALNYQAALSLVRAARGTVTNDLSKQIGVMVVDSPNALFAETLRSSGLVEEVGEDFKWKAFPSYAEAVASGQLTVINASSVPGGGPEVTEDPLEPMQWSMQQIRAPQAHAIQAGSRLVEVGILDSGIDGQHPDFITDTLGTNVDCSKGRDFVPLGPGVGNPDPCIDNQFHGTHVAGIVAAQANELGVVGVAPNVTLIPVKVCDTAGYCYASATAAGITYAGDAKFEVINMSFFVDDNELLTSTEFKCMSDPQQRAFRKANERAIQYARNQGVVPVAALGNSDNDLAHPPEPYENNCEVVPAETQGVVGTMALGPVKEKAYYSNYGVGATDVAAPGGNPDDPQEIGSCEHEVLSTLPGGLYGCISGTSMASPHAAGVAALIVSQFGRVGNDAGETDVVMRPQEVESYLQSSTIDQGLTGYDKCFGNGRIDALRAVTHATSRLYDPTAPPCPEYAE